MVIKISNLHFKYGHNDILDNISLSIKKNTISTILGPNGSGKSTLLKSIARILIPQKGHIFVDNKSINLFKSKDLAKELSIVTQNPLTPEQLTVYDLVSFGRHPYQNSWSSLNKQDHYYINRAIDLTSLGDIKNHFISELSGGQQQRAWMALGLAQNPNILLLDEPTNFLDLKFQFEILDLLYRLNQSEKITIIMVLHDLNLASQYSEYTYVLQSGKLVDYGKTNEVLNSELIKKIYNINATSYTIQKERMIKQFIFSKS